MDENTNNGYFAEEDDWSDIDLSDVYDDAAETAGAGEAQADQPAAEPEQEPTEPVQDTEGTQPQADQPAGEQADQSFTLKHLDETRTVGRDEVIALAQKGMDYDRIRARLDAQSDYDEIRRQLSEQSEAIDFLNDLAKKNNMSLTDFIDAATATSRARPDRSDYDAVLAQVRLERRERALEKREASLNETNRQAEAQNEQNARIQEDIRRFQAAFPDVKPADIPAEVWEEVGKGKTLTEVWAMRENARLRAEMEAERKNKTNAQRSTGSRQTAGAADAQDEFDRLWYSDD